MKHFLKLCVSTVVFAAIAVVGTPVWAKYPEKPITILIPYAAGGTTDVGVRKLGSIIEKKLGQPIIAENKPGGSGTIALSACAKAKPDGYTLVAVTSSPVFITPHLRKVPYNPIKDLVPIMNSSGPHHGVCVPTASEWQTFADLIKFGKDKPNQATYGTAGTFAGAHISILYVEKLTGAKFAHVPFKGAAPATAAILGGHISFAVIPRYADYVRAGTLRVLAVLDGSRDPDFPNVPTLRDLGYDWEFASIVGIMAPAGTPKAVLDKLEKVFIEAADSAEFREFMKKANLPVNIMNGEKFGAVLKSNYLAYREAINELGLAKLVK
ncbi:MAG: tripartite tricarboxylate transporter substrate binding protein [Desulfobacterales bacterium]